MDAHYDARQPLDVPKYPERLWDFHVPLVIEITWLVRVRPIWDYRHVKWTGRGPNSFKDELSLRLIAQGDTGSKGFLTPPGS